MIYSSYTIDEMDSYAKEEGGACLTREVLHNWKKLQWQCKNGHRFQLFAAEVRQGAWCPECNGKAQKTGLQEIRKKAGYAAESLDNSANNKKQKAQAGKREITPLFSQKLHRIARNRGGKCLSDDISHSGFIVLEWQCKEGHVWKATPGSIARGSWCPVCEGNRKPEVTMEDIQRIAASRGGKCLSTTYNDTHAYLKWQCSEGHVWRQCADHVVGRRKAWCPECKKEAGVRLKQDALAQKLEAALTARGGKCLSQQGIGSSTTLKVQCREGHVWEETARRVVAGRWCSICASAAGLQEARRFAAAKGGKCLSDKYIDQQKKLKWECKERHQWEAAASSVMYNGHWCPFCAGNARKTIEDMREYAAARGGKCLSGEYINNKTELTWQCRQGHVWNAAPIKLSSGFWCQQCAKEGRKS